MMNQPTQRVTAELARALQEHVKQWGLAGQDMYWRPELVIDVAAGGEANAAKLRQLFESNGLDVRPIESAARAAEGDYHGAR